MWIELSEFNLKLLIPLIFPVFKRIQDLTKKAYVTNDNQLFKAIRYFTSYTFSFICLIIIYLRTRETKNNKTDDQKDDDHKLLDTIENSRTLSQTQTFRTMSNQIDELKLNISKKNKIKSFLFLALLCLIGFFCYFYRYLFENNEYRVAKQSIGILFDIAGYIILSYLILKQKLYKHSYVSSGIIAFILLILFILSIFHMKREYIFFSFLYYFFYSLSFVTYDILKKKYMNIFFNTPYFMMLVIGITDVVLVLIYDLIVYLVDSDKEGIIKGFQNNITNAEDFFLFFLDILLQFIWNLGIWMTIYYLTPCHYFISEYISEYIYYLQSASEAKDGDEFYSTVNVVIFSISYFINFCCCLIFNEVVILNFCGMDYNTKKRIKERTKIDIRNTSIEFNIIEDETERDSVNSA